MTADPQGHFSADVPTPAGTTVITAAATTGARATGWAQVTVTGASGAQVKLTDRPGPLASV